MLQTQNRTLGVLITDEQHAARYVSQAVEVWPMELCICSYGTCMYKCAHIIKVSKWRGVIGAIMMIVGQGHIFLVMTCQYNNLVAGVALFL